MRVGSGGIVFGNKRGMSFGKPFGGSGTGSGSAPILLVFEDDANGAAILNGAAAAGNRAFGDQDVDAGATASATIYIENPGTKELTLSVPTLSGAGASHFALGTGGFLTTVPAAGSTTFTITFDPTSAGSKAAAVSFTHDAGNDATPFTFNLSGAGIDSDIVVREDDGDGTIITHNEAASSTRAFGAQEISAGATAAITIAVQNAGATDLTATSIVLGGPDAADFNLDLTGFTSPIGTGAFDTFTVAFDPSTVGAKSATISITHNDEEVTSPFIINLSGNGTDLASLETADVVADALWAFVAHPDYITLETGVSAWGAIGGTYEATQETIGAQPTFNAAGRYIEGNGSNQELIMNAAAYAAANGLDSVSLLWVSDSPANVDTFPTVATIRIDATHDFYGGFDNSEGTTAHDNRGAGGKNATVVGGVSTTVRYNAAVALRNTAIKAIRGTGTQTGGTIEDVVIPTMTSGFFLGQGSGAFCCNAKVYFVALYSGDLADANKTQYLADLNAYLADLGITLT